MSEPTKICNGPAHAGPTRVQLDEDHWAFHRSGSKAGQATARCKLCSNWEKLLEKNGPHGWVALDAVRVFVDELIDRCGSSEAVQREHGIGATTLRSIEKGETTRVQKRTVARVLEALAEQRKVDRRNGSSERFKQARRRQARREEQLERLAGY